MLLKELDLLKWLMESDMKDLKSQQSRGFGRKHPDSRAVSVYLNESTISDFASAYPISPVLQGGLWLINSGTIHQSLGALLQLKTPQVVLASALTESLWASNDLPMLNFLLLSAPCFGSTGRRAARAGRLRSSYC